jgi:hypothetical protein
VIVFDSATLELSVPTARPKVSVGAAGCVSVFPDPVAESTTLAPVTGAPLASLAVTVIVETLDPSLVTMVVGTALTPDRPLDTGRP